jgi:hypothetical protein
LLLGGLCTKSSSNDNIRDNLIIDCSNTLRFKDPSCPSVDIHYRSHAKLGSTVKKTIMGPRQSALIALTVGTDDRYCAREAIVVQNPTIIDDNCPIQFINTCNYVDLCGQTSIMANNPTEENVYIPQNLNLTQIHFLSASGESEHMYKIQDHKFDDCDWIKTSPNGISPRGSPSPILRRSISSMINKSENNSWKTLKDSSLNPPAST